MKYNVVKVKDSKNMKTNRVERHIISKNNKMWKTIDEYCFKSKNLYNYANYIIRQEFIKNNKWIRDKDLDKTLQQHEAYKELGSQSAQKTLQLLDKNWKSFFAAIKDWSRHPEKYSGRPKLPRYKNVEHGRNILMLKNIQCRIEEGYLKFSWKPFRQFKIKTNAQGKLMQVRFVPRGRNYVLEIVYEIEIPDIDSESKNIVGIDLGIDNFATISNNIGITPIIINGRGVKSINQYYNKEKAKLQSDLKIRHKMDWSNRLQRLTDKRNNKVDDFIHKASKKIVDWCIDNSIDTMVVGRNKNWKQEVNMGKRNNQNFVTIPHYKFIQKLKYKCENVGIKFVETEESYTSGTSFLDGEEPNRNNYNKERRMSRGLFKSNGGEVINADLNGSYQIMKKVFPNVFSEGIEGVGLHPVRLNVI